MTRSARCGSRSPGSPARTRPAPRPNRRTTHCPPRAAPRSGRRPSPAWAASAAGARRRPGSASRWRRAGPPCGPAPRPPQRGRRRWPRDRSRAVVARAVRVGPGAARLPHGNVGAGRRGPRRSAPSGGRGRPRTRAEARSARPPCRGAGPASPGRRPRRPARALAAPRRGAAALRPAPPALPRPAPHRLPRQGGRGRPSRRPGRRAAQDRRQLHGVDVSSIPLRGGAPGAPAA